MADELTGLGISWNDEDEVRRDVAATVTANSTDEAIKDSEEIKAAWKSLEQSEHTYEKIMEIPQKNRTGAQNQQFAQLKVTIKQLANKVQELQRLSEKRKVARLAFEREKVGLKPVQTEIRAPRSYGHFSPSDSLKSTSNASASAALGPQSHTFAALPVRSVMQRRSKPTYATLLSSTSSHGRSYDVRSSSVLTTSAVEAYRGGDLMPSVNRVTVADCRKGKKRPRIAVDDLSGKMNDDNVKYEDIDYPNIAAIETELASSAVQDDGDESMYISRVEKFLAEMEDEKKIRKGDISNNIITQNCTVKSQLDGDTESAFLDVLDDDTESFVEMVPYSNIILEQRIYNKLLDYQRLGVQWLLTHHEKGEGCILGDEMGLGKTVQIAAMINALHASKKLQGAVLIVSPLTVMCQWIAELHKWAPLVRTCKYHYTSGSVYIQNKMNILLNQCHQRPYVIITTYSTMRNKIRDLLKVQFQYVILDEGHTIANPDSGTTIAAKTFLTPHRVILTGSPIQNTLKELWCLFDFAKKGLLGTMIRFVEEFETPIGYSRNSKASALEQATAIQCATKLRNHIQPYLLRRLKKDVNAELPAKHERVIKCTLTDSQLREYVEYLCSTKVQSLLNDAHDKKHYAVFHGGGAGFLNDGTFVSFSGKKGGLTHTSKYRAFQILGELQMLCNHVDIFRLRKQDAEEGGTGKALSYRSNNPVNYEGSDKLEKLRRLMVEWKNNGHKVLIFSQSRMMLDIIENCTEQEGHRYIRMDGTTPVNSRQVLVDKFNKDPTIFAALMTTTVGGLGLNLTGANRVIIFDPHWNPTRDDQARERAWRIGQRREVCVYRMVVSGTVEEHVLYRQLAKTYVTEKVLRDPSLQRFFAQLSLVDAFYLSSDKYGYRIPPRYRTMSCGQGLSSAELTAEVKEGSFDDENNKDGVAVKVEKESLMTIQWPTTPTDMNRESHDQDIDKQIAALIDRERHLASPLISLPTDLNPHHESHESKTTGILSDMIDRRGSDNTRGTSQRISPVTQVLAAEAAHRVMQRVLASSNSVVKTE